MSENLENIAAELEDIKGEMLKLIEKAALVMNRCPDRDIQERAQAYWVGPIRMAIDGKHEYLAKSGGCLEDTIMELVDATLAHE